MTGRRPSPQRAERAAAEAIEVLVTGHTRGDYEAWARRAAMLDGPRDEVTRFSQWYPACECAWLEDAAARGVWTPAEQPEKSDARECRRRAETIGHTRRDDGLVVHFVLKDAGDRLVFRAQYCRTVPVFHLAQHWTEEQRLSWEEFAGGAVCRGCGMGFVGAREWAPTLMRTPEEAVALEREEAAFKGAPPDMRNHELAVWLDRRHTLQRVLPPAAAVATTGRGDRADTGRHHRARAAGQGLPRAPVGGNCARLEPTSLTKGERSARRARWRRWLTLGAVTRRVLAGSRGGRAARLGH
jgi:hypothetical protein